MVANIGENATWAVESCVKKVATHSFSHSCTVAIWPVCVTNCSEIVLQKLFPEVVNPSSHRDGGSTLNTHDAAFKGTDHKGS